MNKITNLKRGKMAEKGELFVISGSSGVGKGTLIKRFLEKHPEIEFSVSYTTRKPRPGEIDGVNYFYTSVEVFQKAVKNNEFLEWANFSGNYYGTKRSYVEKTLAKGKNILLEIETQGAEQIMQKFPQAHFIFILPPSPEDLEKRLRGRGTETEDAIQTRLSQVKLEIEASKKFTYKIVNDNIETALKDLERILYGQENAQ